jgi:heme exporter protein B
LLQIIKKEIMLEFRQRFALNGLLLYLLGILMMLYVSFMNVDAFTWVVLFWIIIFFTSISAIAKSFTLEPNNRYLYYYSLVKPHQLIVANMVYNALLLLLLSCVTWVLYTIILGDYVLNKWVFFLTLIFGSVCISSLLTVMSAIASKSGNSSTVMSILSLPILLPVLLLLIKITIYSVENNSVSVPYNDLAFLILLNAITLILAIILFPFLYND